MDNTFGSFEYLPTNNTDVETDQFFVVQDDGTFLLNRQVQYVAQVQNVKEALDGAQSCTVYDVGQQQFFVDVTDNPTELISVADNYILPEAVSEESSNNLYGNSFLLQTVTSENPEQEGVSTLAVQLNDTDIPDKADELHKQNSNCTQLTITDEQYKCLQEKGWVLLEISDKIFLLDSFGLRDITSNQDLIQSLRNGYNYTARSSKLEIGIEKPELKLEHIILQNEQKHSDLLTKEEHDDPKILEIDLASDEFVKSSIKETENNIVQHSPNPKEFIDANDKLSGVKLQNSIKIRTKHCFKDVPDKIVLGKTKDGKNLVAKVINHNQAKGGLQPKPTSSLSTDLMMFNRINDSDSGEKTKQVLEDEDILFEKLVRRSIDDGRGCSPSQVSAAKQIMAQLCQVPAFQSSVTGRNVIITKTVEKKLNESTVKVENSPSFVTGVISTTVGGSSCFVHVPNLLKRLMTQHTDPKFPNRSVLKPKSIKDYTVLHVQICEIKYENNVEAISVILKERILPTWKTLMNESSPYSIPLLPQQCSKLFACSSCATIFKTEQDALDHQETHFLEAEDTLTIDTDKLPKSAVLLNDYVNPYFTVKTDNGTEYSCVQCSMKFNKLSNCIRHVKTHSIPETTDDQNEDQSDPTKNKTLFKCKMCASTYYHSSALSKHISKVHIINKVFTKKL